MNCICLIIIQLTISFLIGQKRTVNFRNQRLGHRLAPYYTIIMSRTLKVTGDHVMYRDAWFLRVIMSSLHALCCLPSVKKQKLDFQVCFVDRARHRKNSWRQGLKHKKVNEGGKAAVCWLRVREKTEGTWGKERVGTNCENLSCWSEKEKIRSMYNKTIRFGFCDIQKYN